MKMKNESLDFISTYDRLSNSAESNSPSYEVEVSYNDNNGYDQELVMRVDQKISCAELEELLYDSGFIEVFVDEDTVCDVPERVKDPEGYEIVSVK